MLSIDWALIENIGATDWTIWSFLWTDGMEAFAFEWNAFAPPWTVISSSSVSPLFEFLMSSSEFVSGLESKHWPSIENFIETSAEFSFLHSQSQSIGLRFWYDNLHRLLGIVLNRFWSYGLNHVEASGWNRFQTMLYRIKKWSKTALIANSCKTLTLLQTSHWIGRKNLMNRL